jgi:hypothetical protein
VHSFEVSGATPAEFVARVKRALDEGELAEYVELALVAEEIVARLRWLGTTELRYRVVRQEDGFRAELGRRKIAALHAPFRRGFDERFEKILAEVGATLI